MNKDKLIEELATVQIVVGDSKTLNPSGSRRILVLKLDHLGDFIIGMPAMKALRDAFADDRITLICGSWNLAVATDSGTADEVLAYDYFDDQGWRGQPAQDISVFDAAVQGGFDVAIDLRVDDDTRSLLERVNATIKCGIGSRAQFPFLDIALAPQPKSKERNSDDERVIDIPAERFISRLQRAPAIIHQTSGRIAKGHIVYGPYVRLPSGRYRVTFGLRARSAFVLPAAKLTVEVARDRVMLKSELAKRQDLNGETAGPTLTFDNDDDGEVENSDDENGGKFEFRVHSSGAAFGGSLQFTGVRVERLGDIKPVARFRPVDVHIGEQFSLLVELVKQRISFVAPRPTPRLADPARSGVVNRVTALPSGPKVMLAPLSNKLLRNWPLESYSRLTSLLLQEAGVQVVLLGSRAQLKALTEIEAWNGGNERILNLGGQTTWIELSEVVELADLVICNNSGIAHLAAALGMPTLAIYAAAFQPQEWGPRGPRVRTLMAKTLCSPCGFDVLEECMHEHLCVKLITPEMVFEHAKAMLARHSNVS